MKPSIGRIVHYVLMSGDHRPAIVTRVINETTVNLRVFTDIDDAQASDDMRDVYWETDCRPGSWHWPERED